MPGAVAACQAAVAPAWAAAWAAAADGAAIPYHGYDVNMAVYLANGAPCPTRNLRLPATFLRERSTCRAT